VSSVSTSRLEQELEVSMLVGMTEYKFSQVHVMYLAFDFWSYPYIQLHSLELPVPNLFDNEYLAVDYLPGSPTSLNQSHNYQLNALLSGFRNMVLTGTPRLSIDALPLNNDSYLLKVERVNLTVGAVQVLRVLIDRSQMMEDFLNYTDMVCSSGTIHHYADPLAVSTNPGPSFLPFAMLYGVKGWLGLSFNLQALPYIFNNSSPGVEVEIGYVLFQTKMCPTDLLYVSREDMCYALSTAFYYQATPDTLEACPGTCYTCTGPLSTQCSSCVDGWNRQLSAGQCKCLSGFYDPGSPVCRNCTEAIAPAPVPPTA
jgi:hypothetical protein